LILILAVGGVLSAARIIPGKINKRNKKKTKPLLILPDFGLVVLRDIALTVNTLSLRLYISVFLRYSEIILKSNSLISPLLISISFSCH